MKKAQIGQVFTYLSVVIVIIAIIFLGTKIIWTFIGKNCDVQQETFKTNLQQLLQEGRAHGSYRVEKLLAPCGKQEVCFVDHRDRGNQNFEAEQVLFQNKVRGNVKANIFLLSTGEIVEAADSDILILQEQGKPLCIDAKAGSFKIALRGVAGKTQIELP